MSNLRYSIAILAALSVTACANAPTEGHRPAMRFDTAPIEFSRNPKMTTKLSHTFTTNETALLDVAERIDTENKRTKEALAAVKELEEDTVVSAEPVPLPAGTSLY